MDEQLIGRGICRLRRQAGFTRDGTQFGYAHEALAIGKRDRAVEPFLLTINPGDSLLFDSAHNHQTRALGKKPVRFLCLFIQDHTNQSGKDQ